MKVERETMIDAPSEIVWSVMSDVVRWHEWTASITSARLLDDAFRLGARVEVVQPKLPTLVWTVSRLDEGRQFDWISRAPGGTTTGRHGVEPIGDGTRAWISLEQTGPVATVVGLLMKKLTEHYLDLEITGLKTRSLATAG